MSSMQTLGLGIALLVVGLFLTFSNLFGFALGDAYVILGATLVLAGIALGFVGAVQGYARRGRAGPGRPL